MKYLKIKIFSVVKLLALPLFSINTSADIKLLSDCDAEFEIASQELTSDGWLVTFTNLSEAEGGIGTCYWEFGDGETSTEINPTHLYSVSGDYDVCLTITNAAGTCDDDRCESNMEIGSSDGGCDADFDANEDGLTVEFEDASDGGGETIITRNWNFGDGFTSSETNPSHTYYSSGEYEVCLTIYTDDACFSTFCDNISVEGSGSSGDCSAVFGVVSITESTDGFVVSFEHTSSGSGTLPYVWNFGDGSDFLEEENPEHTFSAPGTYTVCLTVGEADSDCFDQFCADVIVSGTNPVHETSVSNVQVYPVPANESLFLQQQIPADHIFITDIFGTIIFSSSNKNYSIEINTLSIPSGTYFLHLQNGVESVTKQIPVHH